MSILDSLAVKPLLIGCAGLTLALALSGLYAYKLKSDVATAEAAQSVAEETRDKWMKDAADKQAAATGWRNVSQERGELLTACQAENTRVEADNQAAVAKAQKAKDRAQAELAALKRKNAGTLAKPDCLKALSQLAVACPVENY